MTGAGYYNGAGEGNIYDYFKNEYQSGKIALGQGWWTRSPNTEYTYNWLFVSSAGNISGNYVYSTSYVRPCFCI